MPVKAELRHTRSTPRKARLVADLIRGRNVQDALNILTFTPKKAARVIKKLLKSALANAEENHKDVDVDDLYVKAIRVDQGVVWKRQLTRARGIATPVRKRMSHITIILDEK